MNAPVFVKISLRPAHFPLIFVRYRLCPSCQFSADCPATKPQMTLTLFLSIIPPGFWVAARLASAA